MSSSVTPITRSFTKLNQLTLAEVSFLWVNKPNWCRAISAISGKVERGTEKEREIVDACSKKGGGNRWRTEFSYYILLYWFPLLCITYPADILAHCCFPGSQEAHPFQTPPLQPRTKLQLPCTSSLLLQSWPQIELSERLYLASDGVMFMVIPSANSFESMGGCYDEPLGKQGCGNIRFPLLSWRQTQIWQVLSLAV